MFHDSIYQLCYVFYQLRAFHTNIYSVPHVYMVLHHYTKGSNHLKVNLYYWFCTSSP